MGGRDGIVILSDDWVFIWLAQNLKFKGSLCDQWGCVALIAFALFALSFALFFKANRTTVLTLARWRL